MKVMFVGSLPSHLLGLVDFTSFGRIAELPEELVEDAAIGGCVIIPADAPEAAAFTAAELARFGPFGTHHNAPADFRAKKNAAVGAYSNFAAACEQKRAARWAAAGEVVVEADQVAEKGGE